MKVYADPGGDRHSIVIVNDRGKMIRLYTQFRVVCIVAVRAIKPNTHVYVEEVFSDTKGKIYYVIFQQVYPHYCFQILIKF